MTVAWVILGFAAAYLLVGAAFALVFVWRGAAAIDPSARGATVGFRTIIVPGAALLWVLLALKWRRARRSGP
jgi:hypothetical protein